MLLAAAIYLAWDTWGELYGIPKLYLYIPAVAALVFIYFAKIRPELEGVIE